MMNIGFDNEKYLQMQSAHIRERIAQFDNKLYLEFGGKLFDDFHASRVLPGFQPDSKMRMLMQLSDQAEIVIVISAEDIEKNKVRGDLGITYDVDVLRLMSIFEEHDLFVGSVVITKYSGQQSASLFKTKLEKLGIIRLKATLLIFHILSVMKVMERMSLSKHLVHSLLLLHLDLEVVKWQSVFPSSTMSIKEASAPAMLNSKHFRFGISQ